MSTQTIEEQIRSELGIPPIGDATAQRVVILSQSSHLDWDWLLPFSTLLDNDPPDQTGYFQNNVAPANQIFTQAGVYLSSPQYYYSICEIGFLAGFAANYPTQFATLKQAGNNLRIVGGGITSPDNLLPNGECFIRDYLVGKLWMDANLPGSPLNQGWLPDDFGHDSQLPVLMQAMGLQGVGFARVPGAADQNPALPPLSGSPSVAQQLLNNGVDFVWAAADGSTTIAHWMQDHYCQGDGISQGSPPQNIEDYYNTNAAASPTDYIFVPVGCDFAMPQDLPTFAGQYNKAPLTAGVYAVAATFDHYIQLVNGFWQRPDKKYPASQPFFPTPYWTGFYAARPANKIFHQRASRALLGAEVFGKIADTLQVSVPSWAPVCDARRQAIENGWQALTPSTHHDYITGTAADGVYTGEQLPLLKSAVTIGESARQIAISEIATLIEAAPNEGETPVAVFNQLGFNRSGLVEMPSAPGVNAASVRTSGGTGPVQVAENGNLLFMASASALGYDSAYLSSASAPPPTDPTMSLSFTKSADGSSYTLTNHYLTATITESSFWGISSLQDTGGTGSTELIPSGYTGNAPAFYIDSGDNYKFGNETGTTFENDPQGQLKVIDAEMTETGPLRLRLRTTVQFNSNDGRGNAISGTYVREYTLVAGEPFLRMSITGGAPLTAAGNPTAENSSGNPYSVMVRFPFADPETSVNLMPVTQMSHGTTYHWESELPVQCWQGPTFLASHDFLLPATNSAPLAAIFHSSIPAWAIDTNGTLIGCVFRNTPPGWAKGGDNGTHTHHYAIRMPSAVQDASTGVQLYESLGFQTPLLGEYVNVPGGVFGGGGYVNNPKLLSFPATFSLASITSGNAVITAAKPAEADPSALVLRIYQPTNAPVSVTVSLGASANASGNLSALPVTALETNIPGAQSIPVTGNTFTFTAERALTTLLITAAG